MNAARDSSGNLIVSHRSRFIRVLIIASAAAALRPLVGPMPVKTAVAWVAVCLVFWVALLAADEQTRFMFDAHARVVRWSRRTRFRGESGEVPFAAITALSIERDFVASAPSRGRGGARRLVLVTSGAAIPFTTAFSGIGDDVETVARDVQQFLRSPDNTDVPIRAS